MQTEQGNSSVSVPHLNNGANVIWVYVCPEDAVQVLCPQNGDKSYGKRQLSPVLNFFSGRDSMNSLELGTYLSVP